MRVPRRLTLVAMAVLPLVASIPAVAAQQPVQPGRESDRTASTAMGTIRGRIVEARVGSALSAVLVQIESTKQRALSDADGRFELTGVPAGAQSLVVSVVGYGLVHRDVTVPAGDAVEVTIRVAEGASTLVEEITVSASAFRPSESGVASQAVLGSRDLLALRGVLADDPFRAVQVMPGVANGDDFRAEFAIRGQGPPDLGISIDGVDSPLLFHTVRGVNDAGSLALINTDILESASIAVGARPQRMGAHLGAAVDFETRDGASDRFHVRALVSAIAATTVWEGPAGSRATWLVAARQSYLDWMLKRIDTLSGNAFGFIDLQAKLTWRVSARQLLRGSFIGGRSRLHDLEDQGRNALDFAANRSMIGSLRWRFAQSPALTWSQQVYAVFGDYQNKVPDGRVRDEGTDRDRTWRGRLEWMARAGHLLEIGGQAQSLRASRVSRTFRRTTTLVDLDADGRATAGAAWLHTRWLLTPAIAVSPGTRLDRWSHAGRTTASPWLLADWQIARQTNIRGGVALQRQGALIEQIETSAPNDRLSPERARSIDLGIERQFGAEWRAGLNGYVRKEKDRLRLVGGEPFIRDGAVVVAPRAFWDNTMTGAAKGIGVSLERRSVNGLSGWVSYSYDHAELTDERGGETFDTDFDQRHTLNAYVIYRRSSRTSFSGRMRVGSNFPLPGYYRKVGSDYYLASSRNAERLPPYARLDLRADRTFTFRRSRLTLAAEAVNVMNRRNLRYGWPTIDLRSGLAVEATESLFPLLPSVGLLVEF